LRETNEQLAATLQREQTARRDAEAASALKDQFLMTVSHELRTPLTAIAGWARLLVDGLVSDAQRHAALQTIERNARTQTRLIEDLLHVSGIMAGKMRLVMRSVDVGEVVKAAIDGIAPAVQAKSIDLEISIAPDAGCINGDPERLQQAVWNLLSNAVKFTPAGGRGSVTVVKLEDHLEVVGSDTGTGIPQDFVPYMFERFRQADASPSRRHGGLGLGLAIVRSLVEMHGGTVSAHSDGPNLGARFTVRLAAPVR
jgi:signal transduction histidine kinase